MQLVNALDADTTNPTNAVGHACEAHGLAAIVFIHALKNEGFCKQAIELNLITIQG